MAYHPGLAQMSSVWHPAFSCYSVEAKLGKSRPELIHGSKVIMPSNAINLLVQMHIEYPMLFEVRKLVKQSDKTTRVTTIINKRTHVGLPDFVNDPGRVYLPKRLMEALDVAEGQPVEMNPVIMPRGTFVKLQPQSPDFLDISDPKAVLERAFMNLPCLTVGDIFTFEYNENIYEMAVLEVKPENETNAIYTMNTDLSVDFAPPVGYVEPQQSSGTSTPNSSTGRRTMAQAINYDAIAPSSTAAGGARAVASHFLTGGHKLSSRKSGKSATPKPATPTAAVSSKAPATTVRRGNGPQPLRLPPGKLFFGYDIKPLKKEGDVEAEQKQEKDTFQGQGHTTGRKKKGNGK